jgi:isopenicillin N synthase-like dioxygenase
MPSISDLIPPFPSNLPTASLEVFDYDHLLQNDPDETQRLFVTCKDKGFFYLKNHNVDVVSAFKFGKHLMDIPLEEKQKYAMGTGSNYMGYKAIGGIVVDKKGTPDSNETWNVHSKKDTR